MGRSGPVSGPSGVAGAGAIQAAAMAAVSLTDAHAVTAADGTATASRYPASGTPAPTQADSTVTVRCASQPKPRYLLNVRGSVLVPNAAVGLRLVGRPP